MSKFPAELLDRQCFESHLGKLVHHIIIDAMVMMATDLVLSDVEVEDYQFAWIRNPAKLRIEIIIIQKMAREKITTKSSRYYV